MLLNRALFPCGDHMVCIIDDRDDVWNFAPNLIVVKPYKYFTGTDDVNDPFKENGSKDEEKTKEVTENNRENDNDAALIVKDSTKSIEIDEGGNKSLKNNNVNSNGTAAEIEKSSSIKGNKQHRR